MQDLSRHGHRVHVFTHRDHEEKVGLAGGNLIDLYSDRPIADVDDESLPYSCRHVSHAGRHASEVAADVAALDPSLILYDSFAVLGPAVAKLLGLPYVCLLSGLFCPPQQFRELVVLNREHRHSAACLDAVKTLQQIGLTNATPYYQAHAMSPFLNVCSEPEILLTGWQRDFIEPAVYHRRLHVPAGSGKTADAPGATVKIYLSLGTTIWRYFEHEALAVLESLAGTLGGMAGVETLISLGGLASATDAAASISVPGVRVEPNVDQQQVLADTDLFITHHGLNSTLEAILHRVPMLSYPIYSDQVPRARRCAELGLAEPLGDSLIAPPSKDEVIDAVNQVLDQRDRFRDSLDAIRTEIVGTQDENGRAIEKITSIAAA